MKTSDAFVNSPTHYYRHIWFFYNFVFCICYSFSEIPSVVQTFGQINVSLSETKGLNTYLTPASIPKPGFSHAVLDISYPY